MRLAGQGVGMWVNPGGQEVSYTCFFFFEYSAAVAVQGLTMDCFGVGLLDETEAVEVRLGGLSMLGAEWAV